MGARRGGAGGRVVNINFRFTNGRSSFPEPRGKFDETNASNGEPGRVRSAPLKITVEPTPLINEGKNFNIKRIMTSVNYTPAD